MLSSLRKLSLLLPVLLLQPSWAEEAASGTVSTANAEADAEAAFFKSLNFVNGPSQVQVGSYGTFKLPKDYEYLQDADTRRLMAHWENLDTGKPEYYFAPKGGKWFAVFSYEDTGHVKDDEKIDAAELLQSMKDGAIAGNAERAKLGWAPMTVQGWHQEPFYDPDSKRLTWSINYLSGGQAVVNYNTRVLGRTGVTEVTLVAEPQDLEAAIKEFKEAIKGYDYVAGQRYAEYQDGDKTAEYGLAALIAGGAAAVATKKGFWAAIVSFFAAGWKIIAGVFVALGGWVASLFRKKE
ncbi:DUF2167 domain-containing protein [Leeia sp.]|uniref:DUF2167 domain-containing protein n=1 Tax=Leeia sp. TaxID=2884678 RepID=UPI0035AEEC77